MCSLFTVPASQAARHTARQRFPLIRHLIRQRTLPAQHCAARLRCGAMLSILRRARGRHLRLQICHFLAVSLLSLSLITTNTLSNHSLITLICLFTCVFTLSDTHHSRCQLTQTFFHILISTHSDTLYHTHHNRHGYQLGSSSRFDLRRPGMLHRSCLRSCLLLQPLHPTGRGNRRAQRETLVSSSPGNSAHSSRHANHWHRYPIQLLSSCLDQPSLQPPLHAQEVLTIHYS